MGRTIGRGSRFLRDMARRRQAHRLLRSSAAATATTAALALEAARLRAEAEALVSRLSPAIQEARRAVIEAEERLGPALDDARHAVAGRAIEAEERLGPAMRGAREEAGRRAHEAAGRLDPLLSEAARLVGEAGQLGDRARQLTRRDEAPRGAATDAAAGGEDVVGAVDRVLAGDVVSAEGHARAAGIVAAEGHARAATARAPAMLGGAAGLGRVSLGLGAAQACFAFTFRGPRNRFWDRMTLTGLALGGYALLARPALRSTRIRSVHLALGAASAGVLYATFSAGDRFARRYVPSGRRDIAEIYALRDLRPRGEIAARLVTVIGPAEELFWRGLVQSGLMARYGRWRGAALAAAAYGGVHIVTGNFTLFGAAGIAGAHWCALYAAGVPLGALIVSHQLWDVWIFLVQPTGETTAGR